MHGTRLTSKLNLLGPHFFRLNKQGSLGFLRTFLSDGYKCESEWNARLDTALLQKFKNENLYGDLLKKFQAEGKVNAVDVDLFSNVVDNEAHLDALKDITHRFRRCPNTIKALPSTSHAVIRAFLKFQNTDILMSMLDDRLGYGLFPDYYLSSLLMDTFLKASNYRDAVKTAILMMIQEEFDHPIASHLALYSCHAYLKNPTPEPWDPLPKPKPEEPKEIVKVRVDYIREPFFDDHFDITNSQHLIGKTLVGIAKHIGSSSKDSVAQTSLLLGWTLYQKFDKVLQTLDAVLESKQQIFKEGLEHCQKIVSESADLSADFLENFQTRVSQLEKEGLIIDGDILEIIKQQTNEIVSKNEQDDIQKQVNCYREWDILREKEVENQIRELEYRQRQAVIDAKKKALLETEERLNFFDNIDEWELRFEQKEEERKLHQAKMVGSGKTESAKRLKQAEEDSYVPPEIVKKYH